MTHGVRWLPFVDKIIVMMDGAVSECGSYDELLSHDGAFAQFLKMYLIQTEDEEEEDPDGRFKSFEECDNSLKLGCIQLFPREKNY